MRLLYRSDGDHGEAIETGRDEDGYPWLNTL